MSIKFITKTIPSIPDNETIQLATFLHNNKSYIEFTFGVLERMKSPKTNIKQKLLVSPGIDDIKNLRNFADYIKMMIDFYNTANLEILSLRRGFVLELVVEQICPSEDVKSYNIIKECLVYNNGVEVSPKDIDIVFEYNKIEAIECKAVLITYLHAEPLPYRPKEKLEFLLEVKKLAANNNIDCNVFLATYSSEISLAKSILIKSGYTSFTILRREDIIKRLAV